MNFIWGIIVYTAAVAGLGHLMPTVSVVDLWPTAALAGLVLSLLLSFVVPLVRAILIPINFITLGLLSVFLTASTFWVATLVVNGFSVSTLGGAVVGGALVVILDHALSGA